MNMLEKIKLEGRIRELEIKITAQSNFIEALAITVLDEEDWEEGERMLRKAAGRPDEAQDS